MIKLKEIITAPTYTKNEKFLMEEFNVIKPANKIWRGIKPKEDPKSFKFIDTYQFFNIRTNRHPKDTSIFDDSFFEVYGNRYYPSTPSRREMIFCSPSQDFAKGFGRPYLVYPEKTCKCYYLSIYEDSFTLTDVNPFFFSFDPEEYKSIFPNLSKLYIEMRNEMKNPGMIPVKKIDEINDKYMDEIIKEIKNYKGGDNFIRRFNVLIENAESYHKNIKEFNPLKYENMYGVVKEIYITGPSYVAANEQWIERDWR